MIEFDKDMHVLLVDDDKDLLAALTQAYELSDMSVKPYRNAVEALKEIDRGLKGIIVTDVRMPEMDGLDFFRKVKAIDPEIPVIIMTGHADVPMVLSVLKEGVFSFLAKPIVTEELISTSQRALESRALILENRNLRTLANLAIDKNILIGESNAITKIRETINQIAKAEVDILIEGETGTEKEAVARAIHQFSSRSRYKFVNINCAALSPESSSEDLYGIDGRHNSNFRIQRAGRIEIADGGTLYLDNLCSLPKEIQGQFLNVVEKRLISPVGSETTKDVDIRIVATCSPELDKKVAAKDFRSDLYFRLNTIRLVIPPLRDRREDIPLLFAHYVELASKKFSKKAPRLKPDARRHLYEHDWPGNNQELENFAQAIVLGINHPEDTSNLAEISLPERVERFEASTIRSALRQNNGDVKSTVKFLKIPRKTFYDKVTRHKIDLKKYRPTKPNSKQSSA